jgi:HPt (histidine-containing phosphotransfer) domain-containing protein
VTTGQSQPPIRQEFAGGSRTVPAVGAIDHRLIAPLRDLGREDFRQLILLFLDEGAGRVARLQAIHEHGDARDLTGVAHALKGTGAAFGATQLSVLCAELEAAVNEMAVDRLAPLVEAIACEFERVHLALIEELS